MSAPQLPAYGRRRTRARATRLGQAGAFIRALLAIAIVAALAGGLPWGLVHFVGWPLPRRVPTGGDIGSGLTTPMSATFLIDSLACILWPIWVLFVLDVTRAAGQEIRGLPTPTMPSARPMQSLAAALVGTVVLSLLVLRPATSATAAPAPSRVAATAPGVPGNTPAADPDSRIADNSVEVRAPHNGVYDSLWRIADRTLGDGSRWPEIYALNHGRTQADGRILTNPNLIRPGWVLRLPAPAAHRASPHRPPHAAPAPPNPRPAPAIPSPTTASSAPAQSTAAAPKGRPDTPRTHAEPGLSLPSGAFVGAGLVTFVVAALVAVRLRRRIRYRPGSGERDDLAIAPVVRALRVAYDQTADEGDPPAADEPSSPRLPVANRVVGARDGQAVAWNLARTRGLGLIGPGARDAARALLVALLVDHPAEVLIPRSDAELLLRGVKNEYRKPPGLRVVEDLDAALDALESELLSRARTSTDRPEGRPNPQLVLVASPDVQFDRRLQAVLDNGSSLGLAGVLLGQWRPGATLRIREDGTVAAVSPELARDFTGARLFHLPAADAEALLDLLADAGPPPSPPARRPSHAADRNPSRTSAAHNSAPPQVRPARPTFSSTATPRPPESPRGNTAGTESADKAPHEPSPEEADPASAPVYSLELTVLGRIRLTHHLLDGNTQADLTAFLAPKHREVLTYLALHPDGARREALAGAIWPDVPRSRPYNSFHATLSQLRRALRTATHEEQADITVHSDGHYALDTTRMTVDLWALHDVLRAARSEHTDHRAAVDRALALYTGDLATELTTEWIEAPRESLRRDVLDAVSTLIRELRPTDPAQALALLERARALDPYNEAVYRAIARLQARLGHLDAIPRTLTLLTTVLAEIDEHPSRETLALFADLRHHHKAAG